MWVRILNLRPAVFRSREKLFLRSLQAHQKIGWFEGKHNKFCASFAHFGKNKERSISLVATPTDFPPGVSSPTPVFPPD